MGLNEIAEIKGMLSLFSEENPLMVTRQLADALKKRGIEGNYRVQQPIPTSGQGSICP